MSSKPRIGFIGVGLMGHGIAKNIVEKGYPLVVLAHRNRAPVDDLLARGASEAKTAREVAQRSGHRPPLRRPARRRSRR